MAATPTVVDLASPWRPEVLGWLLDRGNPAVRHVALRDLLNRPPEDRELSEARHAATAADPIQGILSAGDPAGWWGRPGSGYLPKYRATAWQVIFLEQLGADPDEGRVRAGCRYLLDHATSAGGGFGHRSSGTGSPPPSSVVTCLTGNLLRALIGLGWLDDERVQQALDWQVRSILGTATYYRSGTSGPGFRCGANDDKPCAWGAVKALSGLARVPVERQDAELRQALEVGVDFLLSRDPALADYPMGYGNTRPSASWFKLGFPSGYVADVLQNLEVLAELDHGRDPRLEPALRWVLGRQDPSGRWRNEYAYNGKTWADVEQQGAASKWVTLRVYRLFQRIAAE